MGRGSDFKRVLTKTLREAYAGLTPKSQLISATRKSIIVFLGNCSERENTR